MSNKILTVNNLTKKYDDNIVLSEINLEIEEGKITTILGKNGSGKTTLIKLLLNMIHPTKGNIFFKNENIKNLKHDYYQHTAAVLESVDNLYYYLTGKQNIEYFLSLQKSKLKYNSPHIQKMIKEFNLSQSINKPCGNYSRGMLQKLSLIIALMNKPSILFLDEPTLGLDFESTETICNKIKESSCDNHQTIILTSHQANIIEKLSDNIIIIDKAKILFDGLYGDLKKMNSNHKNFFYIVMNLTENTEKIIKELQLKYNYTFLNNHSIKFYDLTSSDTQKILSDLDDNMSSIQEIKKAQNSLENILKDLYSGGCYD
ncbi:ABC transporter ATP-binding protein [Ignavigranum ruoffiae]|uniref:ABC-2 type transport system ATP-binding protein n=1 Tax=Ignavigranum ruoffiae TaxID=89093 RepID=A0A1H8ZB61_9LACT|nr:ABC transporter ATP-binding protein [Ignavigranum ruoffiae]SEP61581.1 ABC-2 type transport system ATP-binding protein [Ignavigranum ruoffiae]